MRAVLKVLFVLVAVVFAAGFSFAQNVDLDKAFAELRRTDSGAVVLAAERRIWDLWMESGSKDQNELLLKATNAMGTRDFVASEEILNTLVKQTQSFAEAYNKRATLYFLMGRLQDSLNDVETTLELEPRHFGALSGRGMILQQQGKKVEALKAFEEALEINPHMPGAKFAVKQLRAEFPDL